MTTPKEKFNLIPETNSVSKNHKRIRLLYLPNESQTSTQVGPRKAFEYQLSQKIIEDYKVFSFLLESANLGSDDRALEKLMEIVYEYKPNVIFWQHVSGFKITPIFINNLKNSPSKPVIIYHEGDAFDKYIKRMGKSCRLMMAHADMVFLVGLGKLADLARSCKAKVIQYAPHNFDNQRFGHPWEYTKNRNYKLIMIGSAGRTRIPGRYMPGALNRIKLVHLLNKTYGENFAVYGKGWEGISSYKGFAPFNQQHDIIRSAWLSVNWDHYDDLPYYFSDRLPISISAGVPHITSYHKGYNTIFKDCKGGLYFANTIPEVIEISDYLLSRPIDFLIEEGIKCKEFADQFMESNKVYSEVIEKIKQEFGFD